MTEYLLTIKARVGKTGDLTEAEQDAIKTGFKALLTGTSPGLGWSIVESVDLEKVK